MEKNPLYNSVYSTHGHKWVYLLFILCTHCTKAYDSLKVLEQFKVAVYWNNYWLAQWYIEIAFVT